MTEGYREPRYLGSTAPNGATLFCAYWRGCAAICEPGAYTSIEGARKLARPLGWLTGQRQPYGHRRRRQDYCPDHAPRERELRGIKPGRNS